MAIHVIVPLSLVTFAGAGETDPPVMVVVDMDANTPGMQSSVTVHSCTNIVNNIAVYVIDPLQARQVYMIGYVGGLDRGIAFGHAPSNDNVGAVTAINGTIGAAINPENLPIVVPTQWVDPGFIGPEVQYIECCASRPAVIPTDPASPIFTVDVTLSNAQPGDAFTFHLLDFVSIWQPGSGSFSTTQPLPLTLDTGGDVVPDGTPSIVGVDADAPVPVPPASFEVDYIDGPVTGGGATIAIIAQPADIDGDGNVGIRDLLLMLGAWGPCDACPEDLDDSGAVDVADLLALLDAWGACPG